jgi:hypothetical protein
VTKVNTSGRREAARAAKEEAPKKAKEKEEGLPTVI